uniref:Integrase catalytic domain-containing protein n=1 Tax=Chromera velia CCMP2878 TaxID=1169474 RepID=A0A0G4H5K5_9ALVE|eukprot:Cvel_24767.t1-p1 / transcript=Cvel_24767.t1 / gene=Cvel_24767 / organism=Chromera_velia_CCMP2878 / gene_product=Transposon Ty3-I Gag-Pol polyprotein, putative / transcript_product=Transposon Ty3-I Gag-Pol polyprotein, putative / location=Cvel_scaffold2723:157-1824(+) / protein_length=556 / sequence_SO=supercontig / SO=protein_coding / is_pseudo=false
MQELGIQPKYIPGKANIVADALSRNPPPSAPQQEPSAPRQEPSAPEQELRVLQVSAVPSREFLRKCREGYAHDPFFSPIVWNLSALRPPTPSPELALRMRDITFRDGLLYYGGDRLCVPRSLHKQVIGENHASPHSAHLGINKTYKKMASLYYWPKMWRDVGVYIRACDPCQRSKGPNALPPGLLHPLSVPSQPWESVCLDFLTDLPPSGDERYDTIMVVVCRLIKAAILVPTHRIASAEETARLYRRFVTCKKGYQRQIVSDRDPRFVSKFWQTLHALSGTQLDFSTSGHHDTAGQAERMNRTIEEALRCLVETKQTRWSEFLCDVEFAYNSSVHEGTSFSPFTLDTGRQAVAPPSLSLPSSVEQSFDAEDFLEGHRQMVAAATESLRAAQGIMTRYANRHRRPADGIQVGQYVLVHRSWWPQPVGKGKEYARKLDSVWFGPFEVEAVLPRDNLEVVLPAGCRKHPVIHRSLCKPYRQSGGGTVVRPPSVRMPAWAEEEFEVERVVAVRGRGGGREYRVQWKGFPAEEATWEPLSNLKNAKAMIAAFHASARRSV